MATRKTKAERLTFVVGGVSFTMCLVEHGSFMMGATAEQGNGAYDDEHPVHKVNISRDYYIGQTQVTQALWKAVMGNNPACSKGDDQRPVEIVSWYDCKEFIGKLNKEIPGGTFALPTEAEWEFAARGGNKSKGFKYAGGNDPDEVAWFDKNANDTTHRVGQKKANELGLHDMSGNVREWCADRYRKFYGKHELTDPVGPGTGVGRVLRGGSYSFSSRLLRVSFRDGDFPGCRYYYDGFRLVFRPSVP